jgi:hypothetical protein
LNFCLISGNIDRSEEGRGAGYHNCIAISDSVTVSNQQKAATSVANDPMKESVQQQQQQSTSSGHGQQQIEDNKRGILNLSNGTEQTVNQGKYL